MTLALMCFLGTATSLYCITCLKHFLPLQIKPCSELSFPVKIYFCVTILSLLSVIGLTIETLVRQTEEDFTISLIQLIGVGKKRTVCILKQMQFFPR